MNDKVTHLVIIAGGAGLRMASLYANTPKALACIGGKTILEHQLRLARSAGILNATVFAGHFSESIVNFVGDGSKFGLSVRVFVEKEPMGTAGAVLQYLNRLPDHFFVLYGDIMPDVDLQKMAGAHLDRHSDFTVMCQPTDHPVDSDLLETDDGDWLTAVHAYPHPDGKSLRNLANAALYVVRRDALRPWSNHSGKLDFIKDIVCGLIARGGRVLAYRSEEYIKDIGTPDRWNRVESDWKTGRIGMTKNSERYSV